MFPPPGFGVSHGLVLLSLLDDSLVDSLLEDEDVEDELLDDADADDELPDEDVDDELPDVEDVDDSLLPELSELDSVGITMSLGFVDGEASPPSGPVVLPELPGGLPELELPVPGVLEGAFPCPPPSISLLPSESQDAT